MKADGFTNYGLWDFLAPDGLSGLYFLGFAGRGGSWLEPLLAFLGWGGEDGGVVML